MTDSKRQVRVVGFNLGQQKQLSVCQATMDSESLENCQVKRAKYLDDYSSINIESANITKEVFKDKICSTSERKDSLDTKNEHAKVLHIDQPLQVSAHQNCPWTRTNSTTPFGSNTVQLHL